MALKDSWLYSRQHRQQAQQIRSRSVARSLQQHRQHRQEVHQQVRTSLNQFRANLTAQTADTLSLIAAERAVMSAHVTALRSQVHPYLAQVKADRQVQAAQTQQMLAESRLTRQIEVQALFDDLLPFRESLRAARSRIRSAVWGDWVETTSEPSSSLTAQSTPAATPKVEAPKAEPSKISGPNVSSPPASPPPASPQKLSDSPASSLTESQQSVYRFIAQRQGVRLTEIEAALNLNRLALVDALRSLIQQGQITQRDRLYLAQE